MLRTCVAVSLALRMSECSGTYDSTYKADASSWPGSRLPAPGTLRMRRRGRTTPTASVGPILRSNKNNVKNKYTHIESTEKIRHSK